MAVLLLFGPARQAAGTSRVEIERSTAGEVRREACARFGTAFSEVALASALWVNGEPAHPDSAVSPADEVAIIPPVSGG